MGHQSSFTCFGLVYQVMDALYPKLEAAYGASTISAVLQEIQNLVAEFKLLNSGVCVEYNTPLRRFAYLYAYGATRASILHDVLCRYPQIRDLFGRDSVRVTSVGGGPGTDIIGIAKYLALNSLPAAVSTVVCDKESQWRDCWVSLIEKLAPYPIREWKYAEHDFLAPADRTMLKRTTLADLYILSYCLSCFRARQGDAEPYFTNLFQSAPMGSYFVLIDVDYTNDYRWYDRMAATCNLVPIADSSGTSLGHVVRFQVDGLEQSAALRRYRGRLLQAPRTDPNVAYRVCLKT